MINLLRFTLFCFASLCLKSSDVKIKNAKNRFLLEVFWTQKVRRHFNKLKGVFFVFPAALPTSWIICLCLHQILSWSCTLNFLRMFTKVHYWWRFFPKYLVNRSVNHHWLVLVFNLSISHMWTVALNIKFWHLHAVFFSRILYF